jgi:hypothetical protein
LPVCVASRPHDPEEISVAVAPETVQTEGEREVKLTGRPELEVPCRLTVVRATWAPITGKSKV